MTDSLCSSGSDINNTAALAQSSDLKLGINQTDYSFVFHVPIPSNDVATGDITMKEVKVNVAMPSKVQGLKSLNDTQKAVWLGSAANGAIELLNGAAIYNHESYSFQCIKFAQKRWMLVEGLPKCMEDDFGGEVILTSLTSK